MMLTVHRLMKRVGLAAATLALCASAAANTPVGEAEGEIYDLDFGKNTMVVGGYTYQVSSMAKVQIGGSYGAFTMLEKGMKIEFTYERFDDGARRIVEVRQVASVEEY